MKDLTSAPQRTLNSQAFLSNPCFLCQKKVDLISHIETGLIGSHTAQPWKVGLVDGLTLRKVTFRLRSSWIVDNESRQVLILIELRTLRSSGLQ